MEKENESPRQTARQKYADEVDHRFDIFTCSRGLCSARLSGDPAWMEPTCHKKRDGRTTCHDSAVVLRQATSPMRHRRLRRRIAGEHSNKNDNLKCRSSLRRRSPAVRCSRSPVDAIRPAHAQYTAKEWPEGAMKQRFTDTCGLCHDINRIRVGYTPEGWLTVVRMMQNFDAPVPPRNGRR